MGEENKTSIDSLPLKKVALGFLGSIIGIVFLYYIYSSIRNLIRSFHFKGIGDLFEVENYKFWKDKFNSGFGLKGKDYVNFEINIRSEDASDDCKIKGKYRSGGLTKMNIHGSGPNCSELRKNNKL